MTHATTAPGHGDWDRQLADAFAVVLGRPLDSYDPTAVYAASIDGNFMDEVGFLKDPAWVRPAALRGDEPVVWHVFDESARPSLFDASGSVFEIWRPERAESPLPGEFAAAVAEVAFEEGLVRGADLAPLVERYGVDLADPALAGTWTVYFPRLVSDGTLVDALRAALGTGRTPEELMDSAIEADEEWADELAAIAHPGLRAHLGFFFSDGDTGMVPLGDEATAGGLESSGCEPVAGFEDGHGQVDIRVVRLSDRVVGPRPGAASSVPS
ncbi:hypothetical protein [Streptomyces sp. NPDC058953]|uniref:hypothetical protein n=1 Tax=unclassified Streptomyces TaxID=2593676 RepID=UPI0036C00433